MKVHTVEYYMCYYQGGQSPGKPGNLGI